MWNRGHRPAGPDTFVRSREAPVASAKRDLAEVVCRSRDLDDARDLARACVSIAAQITPSP